jgi:ankyrin repeat protein
MTANEVERIARIADGRTDLVFDHLAHGGAAAAVDANGVALVQWCAYYGDVSAVRALVERGASLQSLGADLGLTGAAFHSHWPLCEYLLENGAEATYADRDTGETALHAALCAPGRPQADLVVHVLLAFGADPNARTNPGVETGCFMRDAHTRGETPLHRAAALGSEATIVRLLAAGADVEVRDAYGESPLGWASWYARPDAIVRRLCFGPHQIHPDRQPMAVSLLGTPRGGVQRRNAGTS